MFYRLPRFPKGICRHWRLLFVATIAVFAVGGGLAACDVVGNGVAPNSLKVGVQAPNQTLLPPRSIYTCIPTQLSGIMGFTNGSRINYSALLKWTSSNPSVATVATSDEQHGNAQAGVVTPVGPGTATITAQFDRLQDSVTITVVKLTAADLKVKKLDGFALIDVTNTGFTVAPQSSQNLVLSANESGVPRNITQVAEWSITDDNTGDTVPTDGTGPLSGTIPSGSAAFSVGSIKPIAQGATDNYTLHAVVGKHGTQQFCNTPIDIPVNLHVQRVQSLVLTPQLDPANGPQLGYADANGNPLPLIRGNVEALKLMADFANGQTQNLTITPAVSGVPVVNYPVSDTAVANTGLIIPGQGIVSDSANVLTTLEATTTGPVTVSATYCNGDPNDATACGTAQTPASASSTGDVVVGSNTLNFTTVAGTLTGLEIAPQTATLQATSDLDFAHFYAIGTFDTTNGTVKQDVSRQTLWQSIDPATSKASAIVSIALAPSVQAGLVAPAGINTGAASANITAAVTPVETQCVNYTPPAPPSSTGTPPSGGSSTPCTVINAPQAAVVTVTAAPDAPATTTP